MCPLAETVATLQAFRKRHSEAQRISGQLNAQPTTVDLAHYRAVLKNKAIVDEAEKTLRDFKPVTYDVGTHVKAIETFETKAVSVCSLADSQPPLLFCFVLLKRACGFRLQRQRKQRRKSTSSLRTCRLPFRTFRTRAPSRTSRCVILHPPCRVGGDRT